jgi:hypothetical protein
VVVGNTPNSMSLLSARSAIRFLLKILLVFEDFDD